MDVFMVSLIAQREYGKTMKKMIQKDDTGHSSENVTQKYRQTQKQK